MGAWTEGAMMMPDVIEPVVTRVIVPDIFPSMAERDWARIQGRSPSYQARSYYYQDQAGREYQEIVGGLVPPAKLPGFIVVIGLGRHDDPAIDPAWNLGTKRIRVLAELEEADFARLIAGALSLRRLYRPALEKGFFCDADEALSFRVGQVMDRIEDEPPLTFLPGNYYGQASSFRDYVSSLVLYRRVLDRGECKMLRAYMDQFPVEALRDSRREAWEDYPAVMALAYAVHGLVVNPYFDINGGVIDMEGDGRYEWWPTTR